MYGERSGVDVRTELKRMFCWHRPEICVPRYYDYECPKCGKLFDKPLDSGGVNLRQLFWLFTGRLPKEPQCVQKTDK